MSRKKILYSDFDAARKRGNSLSVGVLAFCLGFLGREERYQQQRWSKMKKQETDLTKRKRGSKWKDWKVKQREEKKEKVGLYGLELTRFICIKQKRHSGTMNLTPSIENHLVHIFPRIGNRSRHIPRRAIDDGISENSCPLPERRVIFLSRIDLIQPF